MQNIQNVYEQIDSNKRKSLVLILGFIIFISAFGYFFSYLYDYNWGYLAIAVAFSLGSSVTSFYYSDKIALTLSKATLANKKKYPVYTSAVENISRVAGIPRPRMYIIPSRALNAFATGRDPEHAAIALTQGLLDNLSRTELEGVVAHELSHIRNYDTRLMTLVAVMVGSIAIIMNWTFRFNMGGRRSRNSGKAGGLMMVLGLIMIILAPIVANIIKFAISRRREFFADAQATKFTRQPSGLIGALQKISKSQPMNIANPATAHMYIDNPLKKRKSGKWLAKMFSTHPPVSERITALQGGRT